MARSKRTRSKDVATTQSATDPSHRDDAVSIQPNSFAAKTMTFLPGPMVVELEQREQWRSFGCGVFAGGGGVRVWV
ncbi:unnamed protein product [Prunus armeniaca]|uniref:Uncharacterized protein n=1 Tax=Prunus armeniaca TaxID=36596 RepID=A0A6J5U1Q8_PRUAR|nr:unnamed protein product [Prunus armeniaca]